MSVFRHEAFGLQGRVLCPPRPMDRIHNHSEVELNYVFKGGITYVHHWKKRDLKAGQLAVFWGSPPHILVKVSPGTEMAWLTVPLPWVLQWPLEHHIRKALIEGCWLLVNRAKRYPFRGWVEEIASGNAGQALLLELEACFLRLKWKRDLFHCSESTAVSVAGNWAKVECMAKYVAEHFNETINISDIAAAVRLHPKYAMTLFRKSYGITLRDYLERYRLAHAQRLLLTTTKKAIEVAGASGFNSLSVFYERFQKSSGCTPNDFRRLKKL